MIEIQMSFSIRYQL